MRAENVTTVSVAGAISVVIVAFFLFGVPACSQMTTKMKQETTRQIDSCVSAGGNWLPTGDGDTCTIK